MAVLRLAEALDKAITVDLLVDDATDRVSRVVGSNLHPTASLHISLIPGAGQPRTFTLAPGQTVDQQVPPGFSTSRLEDGVVVWGNFRTAAVLSGSF